MLQIHYSGAQTCVVGSSVCSLANLGIISTVSLRWNLCYRKQTWGSWLDFVIFDFGNQIWAIVSRSPKDGLEIFQSRLHHCLRWRIYIVYLYDCLFDRLEIGSHTVDRSVRSTKFRSAECDQPCYKSTRNPKNSLRQTTFIGLAVHMFLWFSEMLIY